MAKAQTPAKKGKAGRPQLDLFGEGAAAATVPARERVAPTEAMAPVAEPDLEAPEPPPPAPTPGPRAGQRVTAEALAQKQREISVSEFFVKNRHLLGFDNPSKALLTTIKEAVDNSLDACEEAGILPELTIEVHDLALEAGTQAELTKGEGRFVVVVQDNGPGIVKQQVPKIFGKLLYGRKFHRLKQSLTGDQAVVIERGGAFERLPIGQLVDGLLAGDEEVRDVSALGIRAPAFDPETWRYEWRPVSHVIRHRRENEILEVSTERGKRVRVTGCHSLFTYDPDSRRVTEVEARALQPGSYIVAPRLLPEPARRDRVNLLSELRVEDLAGRQVFVYGLPETIFEDLIGPVHGASPQDRQVATLLPPGRCRRRDRRRARRLVVPVPGQGLPAGPAGEEPGPRREVRRRTTAHLPPRRGHRDPRDLGPRPGPDAPPRACTSRRDTATPGRSGSPSRRARRASWTRS